ncbi:hypothetical protein GOP47_0005743 [Adiantum capillus-veneris]|uniref:Pentatricopeptide repeat-containing protein n=1 Tax=Adiantum capillus-veneris TaxID=13818 RepID=A0A9D4V5Q4_ADICA|nr:hypothetical protein GOP47_0005743 [Adiantum capillus-veneris]
MVAAVRSLSRKWRIIQGSALTPRTAFALFSTCQEAASPSPPQQHAHRRVLRSLGKQSSLVSFFTKGAMAVRRIIEERRWDAKLEAALRSLSIPFSEGLVVEIIKSLSEAKLSLRFFIWMAQESHMQHFCVSANTVDVLSRRWSHEKQLDLFLRTLRLDPRSMNPRSFHILLTGYGWAGMIDKAVETLESMPSSGVSPGLSHFVCVLNILEQEKLFYPLSRVRERMRQMGIYPSAEMYNKLIWGLCVAGHKEDALNLFQEMKGRGQTPGVETYRILLSMYSKANQAMVVLNIFYELLTDGVEPDVKAFNALIKALCLAGKPQEALEMLETMIDKSLNPNLVSLTMVTDALFNCGDVIQVLGLWMKLKTKSIPTITFQERLISELRNLGRLVEVEEILAAQQ